MVSGPTMPLGMGLVALSMVVMLRYRRRFYRSRVRISPLHCRAARPSDNGHAPNAVSGFGFMSLERPRAGRLAQRHALVVEISVAFSVLTSLSSVSSCSAYWALTPSTYRRSIVSAETAMIDAPSSSSFRRAAVLRCCPVRLTALFNVLAAC